MGKKVEPKLSNRCFKLQRRTDIANYIQNVSVHKYKI